MPEKNTIVRVSLTPIEMESVTYLLAKLGRPKPHDLIRMLIANKYAEEKSVELRYGKGKRGSRETDAPTETVEERVQILMQKDESVIIHELVALGFLESGMRVGYKFVPGDPEIAKGKRFLHRREQLDGGATDEADIYEKGDELTAAVVAFLKQK